MREAPDQSEREETFRSWLGISFGAYSYDSRLMPAGAGDAFDDYMHCVCNDLGNTARAAKDARIFEELTGYRAADFQEFRRTLNEQLKKKKRKKK